MKKTLYSLMLSDEVVAEVDALAHRLGTNRSNLINQILAEKVGISTPERRINDVFTAINELLAPSRELVPVMTAGALTMALKSSLEYKYRPTVRYEVELYRGEEDALGVMTVVFRTQSPVLKASMAEFFRLWRLIEETHLAPLLGSRPGYSLCDGRFSRTIALPTRECSPQELARLISEYIKLFDAMMKGFLAGRYSERDVEACYFSQLCRAEVLI